LSNSVKAPPRRRGYRLSIAIPASLVSDTPHLREKTLKIGLVGRAAAIFRVDEIVIYPDQLDSSQREDINLIATILSYMETPQYLRRRLFKLDPKLRYVGVLPPLRTPHHPLIHQPESLVPGAYREGVVISSRKGGSMVYVGVKRPVWIPNIRLPVGVRVTVKLTEVGRRLQGVLAERDEIQTYWGYRVTVADATIGRWVRSREFDLVIATSRYGAPITELMDRLEGRLKTSHRVLVMFGAPAQGLFDILAAEGLKLEEVAHFVVNTVPHQGVETVRTEEAIYATLAILNLLGDGAG